MDSNLAQYIYISAANNVKTRKDTPAFIALDLTFLLSRRRR